MSEWVSESVKPTDQQWVCKWYDLQESGTSSHQAQRLSRRCIKWHYPHMTEFDKGSIVGLHEAGSYHALAWHTGHTNVTMAQSRKQWALDGTHMSRGFWFTQDTQDCCLVWLYITYYRIPWPSAPAIQTQVLDSSAMNLISALPKKHFLTIKDSIQSGRTCRYAESPHG